MKYNFVETSNVISSILKINNISEDELNKNYDFIIKDEVFLNFKDKLIENRNDKFLIVGDYDADGICATTIIKKLLNELNINSNFIIPSRLKDGYGLNANIVKMAKDNAFDSLILVDNGIVSNTEIELAYSLGLKVFIIDHHEYQNLPKAESIIHSNLVSDNYKNLSAGGLAFILSRCFYEDDLSLVLGGLSTLSDMMSVTNFNRFLIKEMMKLLNTNSIYQLNLLNDKEDFTYESLSFNVIPKINALSRMEPMSNANHLVRFLLADFNTCNELIEQINYVNEKRKLSTKSMSKEAYGLLKGDDIEVITSLNFKEGLCGLIANRMIHDTNKPVIVLCLSDGYYKGSARTYGGFNLYESLKEFEYYDSFGGHEGAVGLSFKQEYYDEFIKYIKAIDYKPEDSIEDCLLVDENIINNELLKEIDELKPFGLGFKMPMLAINNNNYKKIIVSNRFPKYLIRNDLSAICFNEYYKNKDSKYLIGNIKYDLYKKGAIQFLIEDLV